MSKRIKYARKRAGKYRRRVQQFTLGAAVLALLNLVVGWFDVLLMFADVLFVPTSIFFGSVAGNVGWVEQATLEPVIAWLALLYVFNLLWTRFGQRVSGNDTDN